jgi:hypothetical protein
MIDAMSLQKEYIVNEISAAPEGSPYVLLSLKRPGELTRTQPPVFPSAQFRSMDDMFRNFGNVLSRQMMGGFTTIIKLGLDEYETLDIKVGDRISIDIEKVQVGIP